MTTASYRKTQQGEWVVFGSIDIVKVGEVTVTKKSGEMKVEQVVRVGKTFTTADGDCCYGYLGSRIDSCETMLRQGVDQIKVRKIFGDEAVDALLALQVA